MACATDDPARCGCSCGHGELDATQPAADNDTPAGGTELTSQDVIPSRTTLVRGRVRIDWDELGEGLSGDFDPTDPADTELLRFTVYRFEGDDALLAATLADPKLDDMLAAEGLGWVAVEDASYCTRVPVAVPTVERRRMLVALMDEFHDPVAAGHSVKKLAERLSWIGTDPQVTEDGGPQPC